MRRGWIVSVLALGCASSLSEARAAGREPTVIQGMGPETAIYGQVAQPVAYTPRRQTNGLGGGFLELVLTGRDPSPGSEMLPPPPSSRQSYPQAYPQPVPAYAPRMQSAAYGADPAPQLSVQLGLDPAFARKEVDYTGPQGAGTLVVDTPSRYLYLVLGNGRAIRYGIGVGRPGFSWAGEKRVTRKAEWPGWTPPPEMLKRRPDLPRHMDGGPANPLGARALYLGSSLYRIHGTNEPETIGRNVSSGCIRMMNEDVIDLYNRVPVGARVIVI
jgi:lipoprotein-anchoring transpeptidase ErfK/SrfK